MATIEQLPPPPGLPGSGDENQEREFARKLAERYRFAFIDLREQRIDAELFRTIPADLMFRYNFVPLELQNNVLAIAAADPGQVQMSDELPLLLGKKLLIRVATARQIGDILKRTEQSQRVLEQATEAFTLQTSKDDEDSDETISGDRLTRDTTASPDEQLRTNLPAVERPDRQQVQQVPHQIHPQQAKESGPHRVGRVLHVRRQ